MYSIVPFAERCVAEVVDRRRVVRQRRHALVAAVAEHALVAVRVRMAVVLALLEPVRAGRAARRGCGPPARLHSAGARQARARRRRARAGTCRSRRGRCRARTCSRCVWKTKSYMLRRPVAKVCTSHGGGPKMSAVLSQEPSNAGGLHVGDEQRRRQRLLRHRRRTRWPRCSARRRRCCRPGDVELAVGAEVDRVGAVVGDRARQARDDVLPGREARPRRAARPCPSSARPSAARARVRRPEDHVVGVEAGSTASPSVSRSPSVGSPGRRRPLVRVEGEGVDRAEQLRHVEAAVGPQGHARSGWARRGGLS